MRFISISAPSISKKELEYVTNAVNSGWVSSLGEYINRFEAMFAAFCGTRYALSTSNGTCALHLALAAKGIGPGDEVIVPDFTFVATANAVRYTGAEPVMVDIDATTLCIDPYRIREAINCRTKAIIPVHIYGHPADMDSIRSIADDHGLYVVEDAAEAHGAMINGVPVGSIGDCGTFSFYGNKIITTGEGGMLTTNDETLYLRARQLRDHSMNPSKRYWHDEIGFNFRMTNVQAAMGVAQLERIEELLGKKKAIFERYHHNLAGIPGISLNTTAPWATNVYWMVCVQIEGIDLEIREIIMSNLRQAGVDSRPYFYPLSDMPMYRDNPVATPVTHKVYQEGICLPSFFDMTEEDIDSVCDSLCKVVSAATSF